MKPKYSSGDKVFAKVRGYPPWPARVEGLADETPNKMRYHVYFYGTGETAVVKSEDICLFVENRLKLGKPKKHKNFKEALVQIEEDLDPAEKEAILEMEKSAPGDADDSATETPGSKGPGRSKPSLSPTPKGKKERKRKHDVDTSQTDDVEAKVARMSSGNSDTETSKSASEVMSRAGRKIKPKRFADFDDAASEDSKGGKHGLGNNKLNRSTDKLNSKVVEDFLTVEINDEVIKIPLKTNRPALSNARSLEEWDDMVLKHALVLKKKLEDGETLSDTVDNLMESWTKSKLEALEKTKDMKQEFLRIETHMLDIDVSIKNCLSLKKADVDKCMTLLDELLDLKLTPLMLKKHPEVVETIKKTRKYVGNVGSWSMSPEELKNFTNKASEIRRRSEHIYNNFKALFFVPVGKSFWDLFSQELQIFNKKTEHLSADQIFSIIKEPE